MARCALLGAEEDILFEHFYLQVPGATGRHVGVRDLQGLLQMLGGVVAAVDVGGHCARLSGCRGGRLAVGLVRDACGGLLIYSLLGEGLIEDAGPLSRSDTLSRTFLQVGLNDDGFLLLLDFRLVSLGRRD